jgi:15-cis-phytoene synthase
MLRRGSRFALTTTRAIGSDLFATSSEPRRLMSSHARTFRFATRFLPSEFQDPTIKLYAFFRTLDDLVDESATDLESILAIERELFEWDEWFDCGSTGPAPRLDTGRDLADVCIRYNLPASLFHDFLDGMRADLRPVTPATRDDVEHYSYQVASTVGLAMAHVFGSTSVPALGAATKLGIAMQLTNILRDVGGDIERGRVYLPVELLNRHDLRPEEVVAMWARGTGPDRRLRAAIEEMIGWADEHYREGVDGVQFLPPDVRMPIMVAARLYQAILRRLEQNQLDSLRARAATGSWQKLSEAWWCAMTVSMDAPESNPAHTQSHPLEQAD